MSAFLVAAEIEQLAGDEFEREMATFQKAHREFFVQGSFCWDVGKALPPVLGELRDMCGFRQKMEVRNRSEE